MAIIVVQPENMFSFNPRHIESFILLVWRQRMPSVSFCLFCYCITTFSVSGTKYWCCLNFGFPDSIFQIRSEPPHISQSEGQKDFYNCVKKSPLTARKRLFSEFGIFHRRALSSQPAPYQELKVKMHQKPRYILKHGVGLCTFSVLNIGYMRVVWNLITPSIRRSWCTIYLPRAFYLIWLNLSDILILGVSYDTNTNL